ncbi:hypothetical protein [Sphingobacterium sp. DR205]|uniref:hypothetical protein n=1 Tax=Sphingobacterium sp. DR205 TaxID=2713573 RepID=UPI0013E4B822|nr:hypothetical protein [Sphingobacterium sp. DR205]QIH36282.1 hypothetical protein G6053_26915 [Sphingobacterium sp. DR205]
MHHVEYQGSYITLLTEKEILNPYSVLKKTFNEFSSPTHIQDELFEILTLAIRRNYWMTYESPLVIYKKYKKLLRLFEAGWLIEKIRPDLSLSEKFSISYTNIKIKTRERERIITNSDPISNAYQALVSIYSSDPLYSLRSDLFNLLFEGLMPTCVNYSCEFDDYMAKAVQQMNILISTLHIIDRHEQRNVLSPRDVEILTKERDKFIARDTLYDYDVDLYHVFRYSKKEDLITAILISKEILNTNNFWKLHGNPANILYYYHDLLFILDGYWGHYQNILEDGKDINTKWKYPKDKKQELYSMGYKWIKRPWKYLHDQFEKKSVQEWRGMLELCLEDVFSNRQIGYRVDRNNNEVLDFIRELLYLDELNAYEPKIY